MLVDYALIGQRIKEQRIKRKMTQEELAERANVTSGYTVAADAVFLRGEQGIAEIFCTFSS